MTPKRLSISLTVALLLVFAVTTYSQDTARLAKVVPGLGLGVMEGLQNTATKLNGQLDKASEKYLGKLLRQEKKLQKKLFKQDSLLSKELFGGIEEKYRSITQQPVLSKVSASPYLGRLDSLTTALSFLKGRSTGPVAEMVKEVLGNFQVLQQSFSSADRLKAFIAERKNLLSQKLASAKLLNELKGYKKQAHYYSAQVQEYKQLLEDPSKWEKKLLEVAVAVPQFKKFFRENSILGSLFALPSGNLEPGEVISLGGLQTVASVQQTMQSRFGSGPAVTQALQQNVQAAQAELSKLKSKLESAREGSFGNMEGEGESQKDFKPNSQKVKSFLKRLEYGANIQSRGASNFIPVTTDFGLSLGYKVTDDAAFGIGAAYTVGWGKSIREIRIRSEGMALRSYVDWKLKGSFYLAGGYEMNYRPALPERISLDVPGGSFSAWQKSGLIGLSKKYKISKKVKGDLRLMWDFLSYQQIPRSQPVVFRLGYSLK